MIFAEGNANSTINLAEREAKSKSLFFFEQNLVVDATNVLGSIHQLSRDFHQT